MTMIAINTNYNIPTIIADLLISGNIKPEQFILPSTGKNIIDHIDRENALFPVRLVQKVYILQDNLVIAFAGNGPDIKSFLYDIKLFCKYQETITSENLHSWLIQYELEDNDAISFAIILAEKKDGKIMLFQLCYGNWETVESDTFEKTWAIGTGANTFLLEAKRNEGFTSALTREEVGYALQTNILLIAKLLAKERLHVYSTRKLGSRI